MCWIKIGWSLPSFLKDGLFHLKSFGVKQRGNERCQSDNIKVIGKRSLLETIKNVDLLQLALISLI